MWSREIIGIASGAVLILGMVEWRIHAAEKAIAAVESRVQSSAAERADWERRRHESLEAQLEKTEDGVEANRDLLIEILKELRE